MIEETTVLRRNPRVEYRSMGEGEGGVLLHLDTAAYHGLNEVGALIWRLLEEPKPFDVLLRELRGELQEVPSRFEDEIRQFLSELAERDLILTASPV
jgi:Coenzyme PQQ synthesis protein D (PqqD)